MSLTGKILRVYGFGHSTLFKDFVDALENRSLLIDGRAGKKAVEIILAIYESMRTGKAVDLPRQVFHREHERGILMKVPFYSSVREYEPKMNLIMPCRMSWPEATLSLEKRVAEFEEEEQNT